MESWGPPKHSLVLLGPLHVGEVVPNLVVKS